jgi:hypothetical protein
MKIKLSEKDMSDMRQAFARTEFHKTNPTSNYDKEALYNLKKSVNNNIKIVEWNFKVGQLVTVNKIDNQKIFARNIHDNELVDLNHGDVLTVLNKETFRNYFSNQYQHQEMIICFGNNMYLMINPSILSAIT